MRQARIEHSRPLAHLGETLHTLVSGLAAFAVVGCVLFACLVLGAPR
jgi:hypothetical protein